MGRALGRGTASAMVILLAATPLARAGIVVAARQDTPYLVINAGGPTGVVRSLAFSPDSTRIYAGGLDKQVHVWDVQVPERSIRRAAANRALLVQTLRWEISRGPRGQVNVIAASPVDRRVAIGGYGARDSNGDIIVYDSAQAQVERPLFGHRQPVVSLDFSPDGKRLASIDDHGQVILWTVGGDWDKRVLRPAEASYGSPRPLRFLSPSVVAFAVPGPHAGEWRIAVLDVDQDGAAPRELGQTHGRYVEAIARSTSGKWASADDAGNVFLWADASAAAPTLLRNNGRSARSLAFGPDDRLFIATALSLTAERSTQSVLEMWDTRTNQMLDQVGMAETESNFAVAVSPDGERVVTYSGDDDSLSVFLLKDRAGQSVEKPLSVSPLSLKGKGGRVRRVAFADDDGYVVGFSDSMKGSLKRIFDLKSSTLLPADGPDRAWRSSDPPAGWTVNVKANRTELEVIENGQVRGVVRLDKAHGIHRCHAIVNGVDGRPAFLAVGTDIQDGVFLFSLTEEGSPLVRGYRDHSGPVNSLSVSKDGKYLASGSTDQTVKVWSLAGLSSPPGPFAPERGWGARFELRNGRVMLTEQLESGAAARKGLRNGDVVVEAKFGKAVARRFGEEGEQITLVDPDRILSALAGLPLTEGTAVKVERQGKLLNDLILLIPSWEPLLSLFVADDGEWAVWSPRGYYDASVAGDSLFGWQLNRGVTKRPDFFRADQFRREFERPDVIRGLLAAGSLPEALRTAPGRDAGKPATVLEDNLRRAPKVTILEPRDGEETPGNGIKVVARIAYPDPGVRAKIRGQAYINGVPGVVANEQADGDGQIVTWTVPVSDRHNRVRVVAEGRDPEAMVDFSDVHFRVALKDRRRPRLHLFLVAASGYSHLDTLGSIGDAEAIAKTLKGQSNRFYDAGQVVTLRDGQITRESVTKAIDAWKKNLADAQPDDLLVLFLGGHGDVDQNGEYFFIPVEATQESVGKVAIRWRTFQGLASIPCRKLVMLDTCHSGSAVGPRVMVEQRWKAAIRPLGQNEMLVISATDIGQPALEVNSRGLFTGCLIEGLQGAADRPPADGEIFLDEAVAYVAHAVPEKVRRLPVSSRQTPRASPSELLEVVSIPLVTSPTSSAEGGN